ncbi:uncharacterized protein A1O5_00046 [Cladophialophora psammophila CBS 110553]|uniref:Peptidase A1 domain-containing protein n=1 Tax=Cladophialophora psammophila CBS 110553 TaxID=1182543 RepID=W9XDY0_9EURO|nr:uncharacterized protein A1O5_00046 [Cladophialophora psammophila CBS 110553]EXJ75540.1 hypothetical protein A1O5_00046 [Cladophialophora psammophila CBS 110553]
MSFSSSALSALCVFLGVLLTGCATLDDESDGNDGQWSTFAVQIGTPPQVVRLLPSITGNAIWTVWSYACEQSSLLDCPAARGGVFNLSASATWETEGNYSLPLSPQHYLPYSGAATLGFDNITFGWNNQGGESLDNQLVFAYVTDDFFVGSIGLSPQPTNISSFNDPIRSIIGALRQDNLIPSMSWSYLAGASYYSFPVMSFGSLTFGGYDANRLNINANLTLAGGSDQYRPFLLGVDSITTGGTEMLTEPIITALDSLTTQIWLPISACQAFEASFDLVWNETYELYLLSEDQHSALVAKNASVTFTLSTGSSNSTDRLNITLPYGAFDMKASPPLAGDETYYYFPLKQAANETQYTLGRTILQEIYIVANYEWGYITLYEAVYPESSVQADIVPICAQNATNCINPTTPGTKSHRLPAGAAAGIVIAAILVLAAVCAAVWLKCFKKPKTERPLSEGEGGSICEIQTTSEAVGPVGAAEKPPELDGRVLGSPRSELEGCYKHGTPSSVEDSGYTTASQRGGTSSSGGRLSPSLGRGRQEPLEAGGGELREFGDAEVHELSGETRSFVNRSELEGSFPHHELPGSTRWPTG